MQITNESIQNNGRNNSEKNKRHYWSQSDINTLTELFPNYLTRSIAEEMGLTYSQVCNKAFGLKLKKSEAFMKSPACHLLDGKKGMATRFVKGQVPPNKGKKMSSELKERIKHTFFAKGHLPHNTKFDGYERISKDGYREVRVSQGNFELLHRHNWEKVNGPIPEGIIMRCRDGDILNCDPENWYLIDRSTQLGQNSGRHELADRYIIQKLTHRHPELKQAISEMPELIELKRSQIKLNRTINELTETSTND